MTKELFLNGEIILNRKETHGKRKHTKGEPVFTSRMEKREYYKNGHLFDIRNVLDIKGFLKDISENWNTYVSQVNQWIQKNAVKKLVVTGIFTVVLGLFASTSNAAFIQEYTYQVKNNEKIENIASEHGVTSQEILDANGVSSIKGKKILLPKVQDSVVMATILNVRSRPNTESSIIRKYKKGDVVKVAFVENGWAGILIKGRVCYVNADYLTQKQVSASTTNKMTSTAINETLNNNTNTDPTVYVIKRGDTFTNIGKAFGVSVLTLQELNRTVDPTKLKIGQTINIATSVTSKNNNTDTSSSVYVIKSGDTFTKIGKAFGVSVPALQELNRTVDPSKLKIGQTINIATSVTSKNKKTNTSSSVYVIKSGDTFTKISKVLGVSVSSMQELNPTVDPTKLKIGQTINIATTAASSTYQLNVVAQIAGSDPRGTFRFITSDGSTFAAKASGDLLNELFELQGEKVFLTLEGKRGQQMTLITLH